MLHSTVAKIERKEGLPSRHMMAFTMGVSLLQITPELATLILPIN